MDVTVSVSQFRSNVSSYLGKVSQGVRIAIRDDKRKVILAHVTGGSSFDAQAYGVALLRAGGILTGEQHPEWKSLPALRRWIENTRHTDERTM